MDNLYARVETDQTHLMAGPACPATLHRWVQPALTVPTQKNDPMKPPKTPGRNHDLLAPAVCQSQGPEELKGNIAGGLQSVIRGSVKGQHGHGPHRLGGRATDLNILIK